jgi:hypothetical protein
LGLQYHPAKALYEAIPVCVIAKDIVMPNTSENNMVESSGSIYKCFSWHVEWISYLVPERKPSSGTILDCGFWIQKRKQFQCVDNL